jgi:hypothetical protein
MIKVLIFTVLFVAMGFVSCGKKTDTTKNDIGDAEIITVPDTDLTESDEDLLTVDYKEFYDELAPHGEWIEVTDKDIELHLKNGSASGSSSHRKISLGDFFGVKDAHAYDDVSFGAFFVWRPSPNLAVGLSVVEPEPYYVPYTNGQWLYSDAGWYFRAATPYEETVHHYGRWVFSPTLGWIWVPGRVRSPAWVDWREDDSYIAWAPIPPSVYIVNNVVIVPPIYEERYIVVERRYFVEPYVYKHCHKHHKFKVRGWHRPEGVVVVNSTVVNHGPDIVRIQNTLGRDVNKVSIKTVKNIKDVEYSDNKISVYKPDFKKVKTEKKLHSSYTKPDKFDPYGEYSGKKRQSGENKDNMGNDNRGNNDNKQNDKLNNDNKRKNYDNNPKGKQRLGDDSNMKDGGKNRNKNYDKGNKNNNDVKQKDRGNRKENDNKKKGNDNNVKQKGKDKYDKRSGDKRKENKKFRNEYKQKDRSMDRDKKSDGQYKNKNNSRQKNSDGNVKQKSRDKQQNYKQNKQGNYKQKENNKQKSSDKNNRQESSDRQKKNKNRK